LRNHIYGTVAQIKTDSTVLAYVMKTLNERYQYGLELFLLSIDEGITGYRDDSLEVITAFFCRFVGIYLSLF
jgi:tRNA(Ile)-lysidine synthase TilS/MesJ